MPRLFLISIYILTHLPGFSNPAGIVIHPSPDDPLVLKYDPVTLPLEPGDTLYLTAGDYLQIFFQDIHGNAEKPIVITNLCGQSVVANNRNFGIAFHNCSHIKLLGNGDENIEYGIKIEETGGNGISVDQLSTNIEIGYVEVSHTAMSGIMVKTDPKCDDPSSSRENFVLEGTRLHHNHIHNTFNEGIYIGSSHYNGIHLDCNGRDTLVFPHEVSGVKVFNNRLEKTGRNAIQVSSATENCFIFDNLITEDSQSGINNHMNGIQVGGGSRCNVYNNKIIDGKGGGIHYFGNGNAMIYNNLIVNPGRSHYPGLPPNTYPVDGIFVKHIYTDTTGPINIFNNTIINPKTNGIKFDNQITKNNKIQNNIIVNPGGVFHTGLLAYINAPEPEISVLVSHNILETSITNLHFNEPEAKDFSLTEGSPAINSGVDLSSYGINFDITYSQRPYGGNYDTGAYEYQDIVATKPGHEKDQLIRIYPNPVLDYLTIEFENDNHPRTISIYNQSGRKLIHLNGVTGSAIELPLHQLQTGIYNLLIHDPTGYTAKKFIKYQN